MPLKIVRNDITRMTTDAIVNTANPGVAVGAGCDHAVYQAAGRDELLAYRREHIGEVPEGEAFITPGFHLQAKYIIHAVSPLYEDGSQKEEEKLRSCYRKSLALALEHGIRSISFPLISTGGYGYPREEGMRVAVDEINAFLLKHDMLIYMVVFDEDMTSLGRRIAPDLESYIDANYVDEKSQAEYGVTTFYDPESRGASDLSDTSEERWVRRRPYTRQNYHEVESDRRPRQDEETAVRGTPEGGHFLPEAEETLEIAASEADPEQIERDLAEQMKHQTDTFSQYLMYLINAKGMDNKDVYQRAIVDKKVFSKIKNNPAYHPQKLTVLCLCVGAKLTLAESEKLLGRAGYALSPCDKTDIIFRYFIENGIYDMIDLDIALESHGLKCIIE